MTNKTKPALKSLAILLALGPMMSVEGRSCDSLLSPRAYRYSRLRDPIDMVSEIFSAPMYMNSLMRQQNAQVDHLASSSTPRYEVSEDPKTGIIELVMEVPGVSTKDLVIELENENLLRIKGSRKLRRQGTFIQSEFDQVFQLDKDVDPTRLEASLSAGILSVRAPKKEKVVTKVKISVNEESEHLDVIDSEAHTDEIENDPPGRQVEENAEQVDGLKITTQEM